MKSKPDPLSGPPQWLMGQTQWPVSQPPVSWLEHVNEPENPIELEALRRCINRGQPYGEVKWQASVIKALSLESSLRDPWRPKQEKKVDETNQK